MRNKRLLRGSLVVGAVVLACGSAAAGDMKPAEVGKQLAGEWSGRVQMRNADDKLSASMASMSAMRNSSESTLELYYEGFAFGEAIEGAMILSFDKDLPSLMLRDQSSQESSLYRPEFEAAESDDNTMVMSGVSPESDAEVRAVFSRSDHDAWSIDLQEQDKDGEWVSTLVLQLDRMNENQRSAAAERFAQAQPLMALRRDRAYASVPTD
jgi:hypothetical protein